VVVVTAKATQRIFCKVNLVVLVAVQVVKHLAVVQRLAVVAQQMKVLVAVQVNIKTVFGLAVVVAVVQGQQELTQGNHQPILGMVAQVLQFQLLVQVSLTLAVVAVSVLQTQTLQAQAVQAVAVTVLHQVQAVQAQQIQAQAVARAVTATVVTAVAE
jgi:hypothetical protein